MRLDVAIAVGRRLERLPEQQSRSSPSRTGRRPPRPRRRDAARRRCSPALRRDRHVRRARDAHRHPRRRDDRHGPAASPSRPARPTALTFTLDARLAAPGRRRRRRRPDAEHADTAVTVDQIVPAPVHGAEPSRSRSALARIARRRRPRAVRWSCSPPAAWIGRTARGDVADEFVVKHAARILPVAAFDPGPTVIDVSDAESLHRVAERFDTLVLHHAGDGRGRLRRARRRRHLPLRRPRAAGRRRARPPVPVPVRSPDPRRRHGAAAGRSSPRP